MTNGEKFKGIFGFGADGSRVIAVNAIWWDCQFQDSKPFTNADRIRNMSDAEIADFLCDIGECDRRCPAKIDDCIFSDSTCRSAWLDWLRREGE